MTYDLSTDVGKLRLLIPDRSAEEYIFTDSELSTFLALEADIRRATALALETLASDNALVLKVIKLMQLSTDGAKTSDALLKRAAILREQAAYEDSATDAGIEFAQWLLDDFSYREYAAGLIYLGSD